MSEKGTPGRGLSYDPPAPEPTPEPEPVRIPSGYSTDSDSAPAAPAPIAVAPETKPIDTTPIDAAPLSEDEKASLKLTEDLAGLPHAETVAEAKGEMPAGKSKKK